LYCLVSRLFSLPAVSFPTHLANMSSNDQSGIDQSPAPPPLSSIPDRENHIERVINSRGIRTFLVVDHTADLRKNSKISAIWHHGGERRRLDDDNMTRYWRCAYCTGGATVLKVDGNGGRKGPERNALGMQVVKSWVPRGTCPAYFCLLVPRAQATVSHNHEED
jgi:hypothetical protein